MLHESLIWDVLHLLSISPERVFMNKTDIRDHLHCKAQPIAGERWHSYICIHFVYVQIVQHHNHTVSRREIATRRNSWTSSSVCAWSGRQWEERALRLGQRPHHAGWHYGKPKSPKIGVKTWKVLLYVYFTRISRQNLHLFYTRNMPELRMNFQHVKCVYFTHSSPTFYM